MTDSMNFGPEWLRNLSSDGSTSGGSGPSRYQLSGFRYGREEMLGLHEKGFKPPSSLFTFTSLYSEQPLVPLALTPTTEEERTWQTRPPPMGASMRGGRGTSLERGGRVSRGRGSYQSYGRNVGYESGGSWGNGEQADWSPRKEYNYRSSSVDNWRRNRAEEDDGWRNVNQARGLPEKWVRSTSWRDDKDEERGGPQERGNRNWHDGPKGPARRVWEEDHLPEWATENLGEGGGTFDSTGAYHGSDDEQEQKGTTPIKKEPPLQKSASQHNISTNKQTPLPSSKSAISLSKQPDSDKKKEEDVKVNETFKKKETQEHNEKEVPPEREHADVESNGLKVKILKSEIGRKQLDKFDGPHMIQNINSNNNSNNINGIIREPGSTNRVEEEFDRLQEDLVLKLVVEEEHPKAPQLGNISIPTVGGAQQPPPNLGPPMHDKWFYQDPQGDLQGPFVSTEMAEWFRAGYFTLSLLVRRHCDERFYTLGDLVRLCNGNPFQTNVRIPPLKQETQKMQNEQDVLQLQYLQAQLALRQASARAYNQGEPWSGLSAMQQREILQQHILSQQPQIPPDLQYLQQTSPSNPLMHMINQMQQVNKLPNQAIPDKPPNTMPVQLDPIQALVQQMSGLQTLQNRIQSNNTGIPGIGLPPNIQSEAMTNNLANLHSAIPGSGISTNNIPGIPGGLSGPGILPGTIPQKPESLSSSSSNDNNAINNLLRQLQNKQSQSQQIDSLWQQNQFILPQSQNPQWPQQPEAQLSMWDIPPSVSTSLPSSTPTEEPVSMPPPGDLGNQDKERTKEMKEAASAKEERKRKEMEEKQAKKDAEEKRKLEQKRQESEKKAAEEKRKKEEEKIRKELEKARKDAEEKRLRELEEKRKLKELRKLEEEARKKAEDQKRIDDLERERREAKEREEQARRQAEAARQAQENIARVARAAPWSQSNTSTGPSLADIQKAEREKRAEQAAQLLQQQQRMQQQLQAQELQNAEKPSLQLSWASKPIQPRQVKSLAEIQAEEQERLAKQTAELRLAQQQKEKDIPTVASTGIWSGQNLTWANNPSVQWATAAAGFWDDAITQKPINKPSNVSKSNSTCAMVANKQPPKPSKIKAAKKEEPSMTVKINNGPSNEEFTVWCTKALANLNSTVDIPTFVGFLRDIESAADVKEICRDYLGESAATHQFTLQFLEKRRSYKPKISAHKDDMCSPAPAITPSIQHNTDFQEGKGKKSKKSKMMKVDARILGFSVTAAQDRINVGARDYGDNS